ncbi:MAG: hypothetical protein H6536_08155 [Bacteroidales bacterium]|nr:hypothetical protein [Bacteroidales bacterium]
MIEEHAIIHVGYPKTATTWFQEEFFPKITNAQLISRFETIRRAIVYPKPFDFNPEKAIEIIQKSFDNGKTPILSDEILISGNGYLVKERAMRLKQVFKNPEIIIFIRSQLTLLPSRYSYYLKKNGGTYSFKQFIKARNNYALNEIEQYDRIQTSLFDKTIEHYKQLFGDNHVHIYLYEDFANDPKAFIDRFCKEFKLSYKPDSICFNKRNEGLRKGIIPIARFLNIFTARNRYDKYYILNIPYWFPIAFRIINKLNKMPIFGKTISIKNLVSQKEITELQTQFHVSNQNLIDKHKLEAIKKYNYPLPLNRL